jgi:hypothetical protein
VSKRDDYKVCVATVTDSASADVLLCNARIERDIDDDLIRLCYGRRRRPNVLLILVTEGGNPDAAFRIARALQCLYERFVCVISGYCKSAGTLIALGADELVYGHYGELGPLDVQMVKKDELFESESGLTVMTALIALHEKSLLAFEHFFLQTSFHSGGRISVRTASHIATELTKALFGPISQQIDPLHMGEAFRSMTVANAYGERLIERSKNITSEKLDELISEYPSHSFVIDRLEAGKIFKNVREANGDEQALLDLWGSMVINPRRTPYVKFLSDEIQETKPNDTTSETALNIQPPVGTSAEAGGNVTKTGETGSVAADTPE